MDGSMKVSAQLLGRDSSQCRMMALGDVLDHNKVGEVMMIVARTK